MNIREFNSGDCFDVYKWLGAHYNGFGTMFRVYAPNADGVSVIGDFNGWEDWYLNRTGDGKFWELFIDGANPGHMYKYKVYHGGNCVALRPGRFRHGTAPEVRFHYQKDGFRFRRPRMDAEPSYLAWGRA